MRTLVLLGLILSSSAFAQYHRLYRGFTSLAPKVFLETVNRDFFPLFKAAAPLGLVTYRPMLLDAPGLPNEIVLLTFKDEPTYQSYAKSEVGQKIRAAHGPVFDASISNSLIPEDYGGKVLPEHLYALNPALVHSAQLSVGVAIWSGPVAGDVATLVSVERALTAGGSDNVLALVANTYLIEYLFADTAKDLELLRLKRQALYANVFKDSRFVALKKRPIGRPPLKFGEGMDAQW